MIHRKTNINTHCHSVDTEDSTRCRLIAIRDGKLFSISNICWWCWRCVFVELTYNINRTTAIHRWEANVDTTYCRQTNTCLMEPRDRTNPCRNWWEKVDLVCRCRWFHRSMSTREMCWETWSVRKNKKLHQLRWQDFRKRSSWQQQLCRRLMISCYILWRWFAKQCSCELLKSVIVHEW